MTPMRVGMKKRRWRDWRATAADVLDVDLERGYLSRVMRFVTTSLPKVTR